MSNITAEIDKIKDIIVSEYRPDQIILFGSRARGDNRPDSDIDILVVSDREKDIPKHRRGIETRLKLASIHTPLDVIFYTHEELNRWKNIRQSPVRVMPLLSGKVSYCMDKETQREGIVLYG